MPIYEVVCGETREIPYKGHGEFQDILESRLMKVPIVGYILKIVAIKRVERRIRELGLNDYSWYYDPGLKRSHVDVVAKSAEEAIAKVKLKREILERFYGLEINPNELSIWGLHSNY